MHKAITTSVHSIVDFLLRTGDIDSRVFSTGTMNEGTRLHGLYQGSQKANYYSEVSLSTTFTIGDYTFIIEGRADGIIVDDDKVTIDEIKTCIIDIDEFYDKNKEWHLGQAKFYAYMYAKQNNLEEISVRLTYISQEDSSKQKIHEFTFSFYQLTADIAQLMETYYQTLSLYFEHNEELKEQVADFKFPYSELRLGQKEIIETISSAIKRREIAYIEAPTGIGKTAATLFPYVKGLAYEGDKIFYLTSKNSIKDVVINTIKYFNSKNINLYAIALSSKENLCINDKPRHCNPDECPYARDYFKKIKTIVQEIFMDYSCLGYQDILKLGQKYMVCPFEMQLDLSVRYDIIVADYNSLFHPTAHLMRYFESGPMPFYLLVDECHNLPSRIRDMHSGCIDYFDIYNLYKEVKPLSKEYKKLTKKIKGLLDYFINLSTDSFGEENYIRDVVALDHTPDELLDVLAKFFDECKDLILDSSAIVTDTFLSVYYNVKSFLDLPTSDASYAYYFSVYNNQLMKFNAICLDSRPYMRVAKNIFLSSTLFSATLAPKDFFLDLLGADDEREEAFLPSPFPTENLRVLVDSRISTFYKDRDYTVPAIVKDISAFIKGKIGNYFVFFPSYKYMELCTALFPNSDDYNVYIQDNHMGIDDRETFLSHFSANPIKTNIGFVVLGGVFAEGIDLIDDRLIGAVLVGVGLPMISYENDCLKTYYGGEDQSLGYSYAYTYPGINKLLQAAGRVIRSENDRGMLLFIDTRYQRYEYKNILNERYKNVKYIRSEEEINTEVEDFWRY